MASGAGATLGTGLGVGALGTGFTSPARAATTVVDDFGDTNLSGRYVFDSRGATTSVTSVSNAVTSGADTNVLQMEGDGNTRMHAYKGDSDTDLNAYPEIGETFSCWMRGLNGTENMNVTYGAQDKDNKYYVKLNLETGDVGLFKYVSGSGQSLAGDWGNSTVQNSTSWFKVEIEWKTDHSHTVTVYQNGSQVGSLSYTEDSGDPQFTATGVGYSAYLSSGETAQYDYATTSNSGDTGETGSWEPISFIIDNFEDANISEYEHDTSRPGRASIVSSPTDSSSHSLKISDESTELISTSGLDAYPSPGDTFCYKIRGSGGTDMTNFRYGVQNHNDGYFVRINIADDKLKLYRLKNGSATILDRQVSGFSLNQDTWYETRIKWGTNGSHTVSLHDNYDTQLAQISGGDSTWSSGGIGLDAYVSSGQAAFFDNIQIETDVGYGENTITESEFTSEQLGKNTSEILPDGSGSWVTSSVLGGGIQLYWAEGATSESEIPTDVYRYSFADYGVHNLSFQNSSTIKYSMDSDVYTMPTSTTATAISPGGGGTYTTKINDQPLPVDYKGNGVVCGLG